MSQCVDCGAAVDNYDNSNRPRDRCWDCLEATAELGDESNPYRHLADAEREAGTLATRTGAKA